MKKLTTLTIFERQYTEVPELVTLFFAKATTTRAVVKDVASFDQLVFEGDHFKYRGGMIDSGTIEKLTIANEKGEPFQIISNLHLNAGTLGGGTMLEFTLALLQNVVSQSLKFVGTAVADQISGTVGNDRLFGRGGEDFLNGGQGRDVLIGGTGSDTFFFDEGGSRDTIVDFDADGGAGQQDFIDALFPDAEAFRRDGKDTIIDFGDGDTLRLVDVRPSHIDISDFV